MMWTKLASPRRRSTQPQWPTPTPQLHRVLRRRWGHPCAYNHRHHPYRRVLRRYPSRWTVFRSCHSPGLANQGPPLLPVQALVPTASDRNDDYYTKPPEQDFRRFDDVAPRIWPERSTSYFKLYRVPPNMWVPTPTLYMDGLAAMWLQAYRQSHPSLTWATFSATVQEEFGPEEFAVQMHQMVQLRQTRSVEEYRQQFETSMYHLLSLDPNLSTPFFSSQFLLVLSLDQYHARRGVCAHPGGGGGETTHTVSPCSSSGSSTAGSSCRRAGPHGRSSPAGR